MKYLKIVLLMLILIQTQLSCVEHKNKTKIVTTKQLETNYRDYFPSWIPNNEELIFLSNRDGHTEIYRIEIASKKANRITNHQAKKGRPVCAPNGEMISYYSDATGDREIYIMDIDGQNIRQLTNAKGKDEALNWSPDSKEILFYSERDGNGEIYQKHIETAALKRITNNTYRDRWPSYAPDHKKIIYNSERDTLHQNDLYIYTIATGKEHQITQNNRDNYNAEWSPMGDKIVYTSALGEESKIIIIDTLGQKQTIISEVGNQALEPKWNQDGTKLCYVSIIAGNWDIYIYDLTLGVKTRLTYE